MSLEGGFEDVVEFLFRLATLASNSPIRASAFPNCSRKWATSASSRRQFGQRCFRVPMPQQHKDTSQNHLHHLRTLVTAYWT